MFRSAALFVVVSAGLWQACGSPTAELSEGSDVAGYQNVKRAHLADFAKRLPVLWRLVARDGGSRVTTVFGLAFPGQSPRNPNLCFYKSVKLGTTAQLTAQDIQASQAIGGPGAVRVSRESVARILADKAAKAKASSAAFRAKAEPHCRAADSHRGLSQFQTEECHNGSCAMYSDGSIGVGFSDYSKVCISYHRICNDVYDGSKDPDYRACQSHKGAAEEQAELATRYLRAWDLLKQEIDLASSAGAGQVSSQLHPLKKQELDKLVFAIEELQKDAPRPAEPCPAPR